MGTHMDWTALNQPGLYIVAVLVVVALALAAWGGLVARRRRQQRAALEAHYGAEFARTVRQHGSQRAAIADLLERQVLRERLTLRELNPAERDLVRHEMADAQFRFVEDPAAALGTAQRIVSEVLHSTGYPITDDRDRAVRAFSYDHPKHTGSVVQLLEGRHDGDVAHMRKLFLRARHTLEDVAGVRWTIKDVEDQPLDLRIEHGPDVVSAAGPAQP